MPGGVGGDRSGNLTAPYPDSESVRLLLLLGKIRFRRGRRQEHRMQIQDALERPLNQIAFEIRLDGRTASRVLRDRSVGLDGPAVYLRSISVLHSRSHGPAEVFVQWRYLLY